MIFVAGRSSKLNGDDRHYHEDGYAKPSTSIKKVMTKFSEVLHVCAKETIAKQ